MNLRIVKYIIGWILVFEAAFLLFPVIAGLFYKEYRHCIVYIVTALLSLLSGLFLTRREKLDISDQIYIREGFAAVSLSWIVLSIVGALPFVFTGEIPNLIDALFETASGFTTTGASILSDVEALSRTSLFWRSFTHWIGGMGIFVFIMAVLPMTGARSLNLIRAESPGPTVGKFVPKLRQSSLLLYFLYILLTIIGLICFMLSGMPVFDAFTMIFGTMGTGGFGIYNDSAASFTPLQQNLITVFMILGGINYSVYFCIISGNFRQILSFEEVRWYLLIIIASTIIITCDILNMFGSAVTALRHAAFQVASIITTSGFSTVDFDRWPGLSRNIIVVLMIIGACAGSTGGGFKVSRVLILIKSVSKEIHSIIHPQRIKKLYLDKMSLSEETIRSVSAYTAVYIVIIIASCMLIAPDELDFTTNFTAVLATVNNIGPGLSLVGPSHNFDVYSYFSKCVLISDMIAGRLELFPILILFSPSCWRKY